MKITIPDYVLSRELEGEAVLLSLSSGEYFALNEVGHRIWQLVGELGSRDEVLKVLQAEYQAPEADIQGDLDELLAQLKEQGLVEWQE